jgi:hypothetical protein
MFIQQNNGRESLLDKRDGYLIEIRRKDWSNKLHKKRLQALSQNQGSHGKSPVMQVKIPVLPPQDPRGCSERRIRFNYRKIH